MPSDTRSHDIPQLEPSLGVETSGWLVKEKHGGLVDERGSKVKAPPHAARIRAHHTIGGLCQLEAFEQNIRACSDRIARHLGQEPD